VSGVPLGDIVGRELGTRTAAYDERDAILYALAVGATTDDLDLVYERWLRVLPTYACALGLWAVEAAGDLGAYDRLRSLHAAQSLRMHAPMPPHAELAMRARVANVWDKGKAAMVEVEVESDLFTASYAIFLPGRGGWGGERGPSPAPPERGEVPETWTASVPTGADQATLYRLTGDRHPIHIDPGTARANGFARPILHGLCTLGIVARELAAAAGAHPADLTALDARLTAPVFPGDRIHIQASVDDGEVAFEARVRDAVALKAGRARFARG
jgi:acyl dehydratase